MSRTNIKGACLSCVPLQALCEKKDRIISTKANYASAQTGKVKYTKITCTPSCLLRNFLYWLLPPREGTVASGRNCSPGSYQNAHPEAPNLLALPRQHSVHPTKRSTNEQQVNIYLSLKHIFFAYKRLTCSISH